MSPLDLFRLGFVALHLCEQRAAVALEMPIALLVGGQLDLFLRFSQHEASKLLALAPLQHLARFGCAARRDNDGSGAARRGSAVGV